MKDVQEISMRKRVRKNQFEHMAHAKQRSTAMGGHVEHGLQDE